MHIYDTAVIGGGPAGITAGVCLRRRRKDAVLIESNDSIARKILLTGKGRCNITNAGSLDQFIEKFGTQGQFYRTAFYSFSNQDLMDFFKERGLDLKIERQGRVFPASDKAASIVDVLKKEIGTTGLKILYSTRLIGIQKIGRVFHLQLTNRVDIQAKKVILAMGGASYRATGSTGEGLKIARKLGHTITTLRPGLVPLKTKEPWVKHLQGLSLKNVRITFTYGKKKITSGIGEMLFTHLGVSGPLVLDLSGSIVSKLQMNRTIGLSIDLKPGLDQEKLENKLLREFSNKGKTHYKNIIGELLPAKLVPVFIELSGVKPDTKGSQIAKGHRKVIVCLLKAFPLTITGSLGINAAMVTGGGVSTKEIDPRTMESRILKGLYFAGEIIDGSAPSGGYNLQQAFSTGYLAGEKAAYA